MDCCDQCVERFSSEEHKLYIWVRVCSVAESCGILSAERIRVLDDISKAWRVKVPENLMDMACMYYRSSYIALIEDHDIWATHNARTQQVFNLFFHLSTSGLLIDDVF